VSYGLTQSLHKFWKRASFAPVYLVRDASYATRTPPRLTF
jgi:N-acetyltransferase 10